MKKAALISDIVQSISVIPNEITRSVYIHECAKQMEIDEEVLVREVTLKRVERSAGSEAKEFVRRQHILHGNATTNQNFGTSYPKQVIAGSSAEELERELIKYLITVSSRSNTEKVKRRFSSM